MSRHRHIHVLLCCVLLVLVIVPACAGMPIANLPDELDETYDLTWTLQVTRPIQHPLTLNVEEMGATAYRLQVTANRISWATLRGTTLTPLGTTTFPVPSGTSTWTLKRRAETMALLCNHRLVLCAPAPAAPTGTVRWGQVPAGVTVREPYYQKIEPVIFGDDFMRPEALEQLLTHVGDVWVDDDCWRVAHYRRDDPQVNPHDPQTGELLTNPWQLSLFPVYETSTNGFWYLYTGVGPSWVVPQETLLPRFSDSYAVQVAVRPDYDSVVGLLAAYQDSQNYLLLRWRQREETAPTPRLELLAMIDGQTRVLATSRRGFDPAQWYTLRLNVSWQRVQASLDGELVCDIPNPGSVEGQIGLYADGTAHPRRPRVDPDTYAMYVVTEQDTGRTRHEADELGCTYFDDVRVEPWTWSAASVAPYAMTTTGRWRRTEAEDSLTALSAGHWQASPDQQAPYRLDTRLQLPPGGQAGIDVQCDATHGGYRWVLTTTEQRLYQLTPVGNLGRLLSRSATRISPATWTTVQVAVDGPYLACTLQGARVLEAYDATRTHGRWGLWAGGSGVRFSQCHTTSWTPTWRTVRVHDGFARDKWLSTWASAEAEWVPGFTPPTSTTALGGDRTQIGAAAPYPTSLPGVYWYKSGLYHDLRVACPLSPDTLDGQTLYLTTHEQTEGGYRLTFTRAGGQGSIRLWRRDTLVLTRACALTPASRFTLTRRGTMLVGTVQEDADAAEDDATDAEGVTPLFVYQDPAPVPATQLGFLVTQPRLPAAALIVAADAIQETFEQAPVDWISQSGVWKVMARYSCQPQWNWFGGFGAGTPTVWSKYRLEGDQTVEAYLGVKMQYEAMTESEGARFRDLNLTICADGAHVTQGYTVIRAGRLGGVPTTMLLRNGVVVQTSTRPDDLLPDGGTGHRQWFATRMEKRGAELRVYLDNRLAMTYTDPQPLAGGYVAVWSHNNGILIGRANLSAERLERGTPQAAAPLYQQAALTPQVMPRVTVNGTVLSPVTFETGLEGVQERNGLSGRLSRTPEKTAGAPNTVLTVVNTYPAGDAGVTLAATPHDLAVTPLFHADYRFPSEIRLNLYLRQQTTWYELQLTGGRAQDPGILPAGTVACDADGAWHHLAVDLAALLTRAVRAQTGHDPATLVVDEVVLADWEIPADLRAYGFGHTPGGSSYHLDNLLFTPRLQGPVTLSWTLPDADSQVTWWVGQDTDPRGAATTATTQTTQTVTPASPASYWHLQARDAQGTPGPVFHLPLY